MSMKLVHNNEETVFLIITIEIYLFTVSTTIGGLHQELNPGTTGSSAYQLAWQAGHPYV